MKILPTALFVIGSTILAAYGSAGEGDQSFGDYSVKGQHNAGLVTIQKRESKGEHSGDDAKQVRAEFPLNYAFIQ